ncbi:hypothetical protein EV424DRAFT_1350803 [Suillus variegatus]|nr:hypothetical protein EV424DRAFT_1350803 [Suillus variegatus]
MSDDLKIYSHQRQKKYECSFLCRLEKTLRSAIRVLSPHEYLTRVGRDHDLVMSTGAFRCIRHGAYIRFSTEGQSTNNLGALQSYGHSGFEEMPSNVQMTHRLVAKLAYTIADKLIARLAGYDIKKHEWITFQGLDCDKPSDDQYEQPMVRAVVTLNRCLDTDVEDFMNMAQRLAGAQDPTPQHIKKSLKVRDVPFSVRSKVARFFELRAMHSPEKPGYFRTH